MLCRMMYIRFTLLRRPRVPSINVLIKVGLFFFNYDMVMPIEVVYIRCIFHLEETMHVCGALMFPLISAKMRKDKL